ncbi:hypothetical protein MMC25_001153 [Agyrium rufum]|nr:hypothetical protein [Agyrium rufum]
MICPECYDPIRTIFESRGYRCICPALPSSGAKSYSLDEDFTGDIDAIRVPILKLVEDTGVVVVVHSYAGLSGGQALEGLDKESCKAKGLKGGVIRIIYVNAYLVPEGFQHSPRGTRDNMIPIMQTDFESGTITLDLSGAKDLLYQDMSLSSAMPWVEKLRTQSLGVYYSTTIHAAWRHIPTSYIICTLDLPSTVGIIHHLISTAKASGAHKVDSVIEVDAGHSPFLSRPEWTVDTLIAEAAKVYSGVD